MQDDELPQPPADEPDAAIDRALDAWTPLAPPADFADRVLAARGGAVLRPPRGRRAAAIGAAAVGVAGAAAAIVAVALRSPPRAASGALVATHRTSQALGDRGIAVAEAESELAWRIDDGGAADLIQRTGNVFYRVERGEPFVVHTPAGDVRVTGTCFRIEVEAMNTNQKLVLAGVAGAAIASTVLVTVYEGHVIAETHSARTELAAGSSATLGPGATISAGSAGAVLATPTDDAHATREQLLVRTRQQQVQLVTLQARLATLENAAASPEVHDVPEPGRVWHDPSPEKLAEWAAECHVRTDEPGLERFSPSDSPDKDLGLQPGEIADYNAAMSDVARRWKELVRGLYIETTGDTAGVDTLSVTAMHREIEDKSPRSEHNVALQRIAQERAGLAAPPADLSKTAPLERLMRAYVQLGDQSEATLARRLGPQRAHAIRGEGWGYRSEMGGCPDATGSR